MDVVAELNAHARRDVKKRLGIFQGTRYFAMASRRRFGAATYQGEFAGGGGAIAEDARRRAPGELGQTVEVIDDSRAMRPAYATGTAHPAARHLEFGTVHRPATPWLGRFSRSFSRRYD